MFLDFLFQNSQRVSTCFALLLFFYHYHPAVLLLTHWSAFMYISTLLTSSFPSIIDYGNASTFILHVFLLYRGTFISGSSVTEPFMFPEVTRTLVLVPVPLDDLFFWAVVVADFFLVALVALVFVLVAWDSLPAILRKCLVLPTIKPGDRIAPKQRYWSLLPLPLLLPPLAGVARAYTITWNKTTTPAAKVAACNRFVMGLKVQFSFFGNLEPFAAVFFWVVVVEGPT